LKPEPELFQIIPLIENIMGFLQYKEESPLIFTSAEFWIFFFIFLIFFSLSYKRKELKNTIILIFSLFFYYKSSGWAVLLLLHTINQDYWIARWIGYSKSLVKKKFLIWLSVVSNLLVLAYFKYAFLFVDFLNSILNSHIPKLNWIVAIIPNHDLLNIDADHILLPVGISFFIFHTLSYTIDVYRGIVTPLKNWIDYAVFVSFFPELVAGPIVRARDFVEQLVAPYSVNRAMFGKGLCLILGGLFKKIVLSDVISTGIVDRVFDQPELASGPEAWMAMYGYGIQIFCDFSGYTDIAIGLALTLGYNLKPNFDQPYKSLTITEFWRRWHISLSVWLRDYIYIPLGGNRHGNVRTYLNLIVTMLLGGLWHGASYKFILWGGLHGGALAIHKLWNSVSSLFKIHIPGWISWCITIHFAFFCWIPFRADSWKTALQIFQKLWISWDVTSLPDIYLQFQLVIGLILLGFVLHFMPQRFKTGFSSLFETAPIWVLLVVTFLSLTVIYQFKTAESKPFIYFQF